MSEFLKENTIPPFETLKNLEIAPYPQHLGGDRLIMVLSILEHEAKKNQNKKEIESDRDATIKRLTNPANKAFAIPDTYNTLYGVMEASKLKGGFTEYISAENVEVSEEKLDLSNTYLMPYFVTHVLKIDENNGLMNGQQIVDYYKQPINHQELINNVKISDQSFCAKGASRENDNIIVRLDENDRHTIYDGNGRFMRRLFEYAISQEPIDNKKINAWVLKDSGSELNNHWIPTSKVADLIKFAVEDHDLKEPAKQIFQHLYHESPECLNLVLDRAAEMSEYKVGANSAHDFVAELRADWKIS